MATPTVPFSFPGCRLDHVRATEAGLLLSAHSTARSAACPGCGRRSRRLHGSYIRAPADLPISERAVRLRLRVRRFRCDNPTCSRKTFAEPLSHRLAEVQVRVGFAAGAEPGARWFMAGSWVGGERKGGSGGQVVLGWGLRGQRRGSGGLREAVR